MNTLQKKEKKNGYALLFTLVIVSIMTAIATGVASNIFKQTILSTTANDSQIAFYQADTAAECALALDQGLGFLVIAAAPPPGNIFNCGYDKNDTIMELTATQTSTNIFDLVPPSTLTGPSFKITADKTASPATKLKVYGYNFGVSEVSNRKVERGIEVNY